MPNLCIFWHCCYFSKVPPSIWIEIFVQVFRHLIWGVIDNSIQFSGGINGRDNNGKDDYNHYRCHGLKWNYWSHIKRLRTSTTNFSFLSLLTKSTANYTSIHLHLTNLRRVMIIDLDAHQGNGHETDFANDGMTIFLFVGYV